MRNLLRKQGKKSFNPGKAAAMAFLTAKDPATIKLIRNRHDRVGLQGAAPRPPLGKSLGLIQARSRRRRPPGQGAHQGAGDPLHQQADAGQPAQAHLRALLDIEDDTVVPVIRDPQKASARIRTRCSTSPAAARSACFSQVGLATQAMLYHVGATTVLPPGYLCCGYPQTAAGEEDKGQKITTDNRVLFHRVANTLNYLDIKTVIVSCGTCMDQLQKYQFEKIFPGCRLLDIHEYLMEKGVKLDGVEGTRYMYHEPCHTPMKTCPASRWPTS
jgi:Fe-S oxidoreductase